jgi:hypothetical protein
MRIRFSHFFPRTDDKLRERGEKDVKDEVKKLMMCPMSS